MKNIDGKILSSWLTRQTVLKKKKKKLHNPVRCKLKEGRKKYSIREREREVMMEKNIWLLVMKNRPCAKYIHVKPF